MKTHFCHIEWGYESDLTYYSDTACGLVECESDMSDDKTYVTCKNCLKVLNRKPIVKNKCARQRSNETF